MLALSQFQRALRRSASPAKAAGAKRFFKTAAGQYGAGDIFIGITVPELRDIVLEHGATLSFGETNKLLISKIHEERLAALFILVGRFKKGTVFEQDKIYKHYLESTKYINNWDLVDASADKIVGAYLINRPKTILFYLAQSKNLWERRIAIVATYYFIKNNEFSTTLRIAAKLAGDNHDLIHKAVGWMLREVGKRSLVTLEDFLGVYAATMPRTMLRYSIERFSNAKRQFYLRQAKLKNSLE